MQVSRLDDHMKFFLASIPEDEYKVLLQIFAMFEACDIKDQKISCS